MQKGLPTRCCACESAPCGNWLAIRTTPSGVSPSYPLCAPRTNNKRKKAMLRLRAPKPPPQVVPCSLEKSSFSFKFHRGPLATRFCSRAISQPASTSPFTPCFLAGALALVASLAFTYLTANGGVYPQFLAERSPPAPRARFWSPSSAFRGLRKAAALVATLAEASSRKPGSSRSIPLGPGVAHRPGL